MSATQEQQVSQFDLETTPGQGGIVTPSGLGGFYILADEGPRSNFCFFLERASASASAR